jgi:hypothetical protein
VVLSPDWLGAALAGLTGDQVAACGSIEDREGDFMVSGQRAITYSSTRRDSIWPRCGVWRWSWQVPNHEVSCEPVEFVGHRALAVKTDVAQKVRHDPELTAGGDDVGYSLALRHAGYELRVANRRVDQPSITPDPRLHSRD